MARPKREIDYRTPRIDRHGRLTIPAEYRDRLKLTPGDSVALVYSAQFDGLVLTALDVRAGRRAG